MDEEELMRSYVQLGKFKIVSPVIVLSEARGELTCPKPDPFYEVGEKAYLEYEDRRRGSFVVIIASEGRWNKDKKDNEYQLKLGDGSLYKDGAWVGEKRLKDSS